MARPSARTLSSIRRDVSLSHAVAPTGGSTFESPPIRLMIVGAPKAGTTSLKNYLGQHPGIRTHEQREMRFFASDQNYREGYDAVFPTYFPEGPRDACVLAAKSVAVFYSPEAVRRLRDHNPSMELVVSLRDPIDRAHSEYWYSRRRGLEEVDSFGAAVLREMARGEGKEEGLRPTAYLCRSRYAEHIERLLSIFPREQLHVVFMEAVRQDAVETCQRLFALFDSLDPAFEPRVDTQYNEAALPRSMLFLRLLRRPKGRFVSGTVRGLLGDRRTDKAKAVLESLNERRFQRPPMDTALRRKLEEYFRPHNDRLAMMIGSDSARWNG